MKSNNIIFSVLLLSIAFPVAVLALNFESGEEIISTQKTMDDYYAAGRTVLVSSTINGDLSLAGGKISVDSKVSQDVNLAGGELNVNGEAGDDVRLLGGNINVNSIIKGDLIAFGGNIILGSNSFVGGNLVFGGGNVTINGAVNGDIYGGGGNVTINNTINGNAKLYNVESLNFGPNGKIMGKLSYQSQTQSLTANNKNVMQGIDFRQSKMQVSDKDISSVAGIFMAGFTLFRLLTLLFAGLFIVWIFRFFLISAADTGYSDSLKSFGIGLLIAITTPIAALISLVTGVGISLSFILFLLWLIILSAGKLTAVMLIGMRIIPLKNRSGFLGSYAAFAIGALIFVLISMVPLIGWIIKFIFAMIGTGAIAIYLTKTYNLLLKKKN